MHALDVLPVPDRLEKRIREPEVQDILHRFLAEVVIDAEDRVLGKRAMQRRVERARRLEVAPERLFDDDPRALGAAGARQVLDGGRKRAGRNREIEQRTLGPAERLPDLREELELAIVAGNVLQQRREARERRLVDRAPFADTLLAHALDQLLAIHRQCARRRRSARSIGRGRERLQRRKNLLVREIACDPEHDQGVGLHPCFTITSS